MANISKAANGAATPIPQPDKENPPPRVGDVWFNYRSMQEVRVVALDGARVTIQGLTSGRATQTSTADVDTPRWFKFLRHEDLPEARRTNALLEQLAAVWLPRA